MANPAMFVLAQSFAVAIIIIGIASWGDREKPAIKYPHDYRHSAHVKYIAIQKGDSFYSVGGGTHNFQARTSHLPNKKGVNDR